MSIQPRPSKNDDRPQLHLVDPAAPHRWDLSRPPALLACAGAPISLTSDEADLIRLTNDAASYVGNILEADTDPDDVPTAEYVVEYMMVVYGLNRRAKGDRVVAIESNYRRYLIPYFVEHAFNRRHGVGGVATLRLPDLEAVPRLLAGDSLLPAATVAADQFPFRDRTGLRCLHLSLRDAESVVTEVHAFHQAIADGRISAYRDIRSGEDLVRPHDLRQEGLLTESDRPHGVAASTAKNILRDLKLALGRARQHGATIGVDSDIAALEPLPERRQRDTRPKPQYVSLQQTRAVASVLPPIGQVVLWMERLLGLRISEGYGPRVRDLSTDENGRAWLSIASQGGNRSLERDPDTGLLLPQDHKSSAKSAASVRTIPLPQELARMLNDAVAIYHTDADTGIVLEDNRLVPGLRDENSSGQAAYRNWLARAQRTVGVDFLPHTLRKALVTDLKDAGIERRLAHFYTGHELEGTVHDTVYDLGPGRQLVRIAEILDQQLAHLLGDSRMISPSASRHSWGHGSRRWRQRLWVEEQLSQYGWRPAANEARGRELTAEQVAERIGRSVSVTRRYLSGQVIPAHHRTWGKQKVWAAWERDVDAYLSGRGTTLSELADEHGWTYHQLYALARELGVLTETQTNGRRTTLADGQARLIAAEVERRETIERTAMCVTEATMVLDLSVKHVAELIKQGFLHVTPGPTHRSPRYVTRSSVDAYLERYSAKRPDPSGVEPTAPIVEVAKVLGMSRPAVTALVQRRQLQAITKGRRQHIVLTTVIDWARDVGLDDEIFQELEHLAV